MGSRIRSSADHIFDCFCEIALPSDDKEAPFILQQYPEATCDADTLKMMISFAYPYQFSVQTVMHYSFVLTSMDSKWTFGFTRHAPNSSTCLVILSSYPWHDTFYKALNHIAELINKQKNFLTRFLENLYTTEVPQPGLQLMIVYSVDFVEHEFKASCPDHNKLPTIPEDRNLTEYFNAVDLNNMITIFASMLNERRILITSKRLPRLTACVQAVNTLIYPMFWQHILICLLPNHLLDYLSAPMPFLIGVPAATMKRVKQQELGDIVFLDADDNRISTPFDDVNLLPTEVLTFLKKNLKGPHQVVGDNLSRTFLRALVMLIGGYRDALKFVAGQRITFNKEAFVQSRPSTIQPFLHKMLQLQLFQQFIEGRLLMLNEGEGFSGEFESEVNIYEEKAAHRMRTQYKEWLGAMKKEGGAILKSVNPVMKQAYRQVKDKGRRAYKDIRSRIHEINHQGHVAKSTTLNIAGSDSAYGKPASAPSSPIMSSKKKGFGIKKSVSGIVVNKTEKTITYVRDKATPNAGDTILLNGRQDTLAPEASSEDSDIESKSSDSNGNEFNYKPINLDLMSDLNDILIHKFSACDSQSDTTLCNEDIKSSSTINNLLDLSDNVSEQKIFFIGDEVDNALIKESTVPAPLPPPRAGLKKPRNQMDNLLIELDSPPDEQFDPLSSSFISEQNLTAKTPPYISASNQLPFHAAQTSSNASLTQSINLTNYYSSSTHPSSSPRLLGVKIASNPFLISDRNTSDPINTIPNNNLRSRNDSSALKFVPNVPETGSQRNGLNLLATDPFNSINDSHSSVQQTVNVNSGNKMSSWQQFE